MRKGVFMSEVKAEATKPKRSRSTKKAAEEAPVEISNVIIEEVDNNSTTEDGQTVITGPKKMRPARASNMHSKDESNTVSSRAADRALNRFVEQKAARQQEEKKIAIWSDKNIRWTGVGSLTKGYNIVSEEAADKWLDKEGIRKATPQEVATYYGK